MKKFIKTALLSLTALPLLAGCGGKPVDIEALAKEATNIVGVSYGGLASDGLTLAGASLITEYTHEGYKFGFEYTVTKFNESAEYKYEYVKIEGNSLIAKVPTFKDLNPGGLVEGAAPAVTYAAYKLNADVKYLGVAEGKEVAKNKVDKVVNTANWNIKVNAEEVEPVWQKIHDARLKGNGETVVTSGYVVAFMNNVEVGEFRNGFWIADGSEGLMLYAGKLENYFGQFKIGDLVTVIGTASPYNGLFEVKPDVIQLAAATPESIAQPVYKTVNETELKAMTTVNTNELVKVENCTITTNVSTLTAAASTQITLKVKFGSTTWDCVVNKHTNLAQREALVAHLKANQGKTFTLRTIISCYNKLQFGINVCGANEGLLENFIFNS